MKTKWHRILFLLVISICMLISMGTGACATSPETEEPTQPTPPLFTEWSADGIIKVREYQGNNTYGDFQIFWRQEEQLICIGIKARTTGWVAMALQPGSRMKDADMIVGYFQDGKAIVSDQYSTDNFGPHVQDEELGGNDDILEYAGSESEGFTTIEFKRALNTGDRYDVPISVGVNQIIWAFGGTDDFTRQHSRRGYGEINL